MEQRISAIRLGLAALLMLALAGCYLPDRFEANINIDRTGDYAFEYRGDLISFNFLRKIGEGEVTGDDPEEIAKYVSDLRRDSGFQSVDYIGQARYRVEYRRQNNILAVPNFSFVRRNSLVFNIKRRMDGLVEIAGHRPVERYREELRAAGFEFDGVVRIWTNAEVVEHNADAVQEGPRTLYAWRIETMEREPPKLVLVPRP